jgi:hypothetical protein
MLVMGALQVLQVLLERLLIELGEELPGGGGVEPADVVDQLKFVHDGFTLRRRLLAGIARRVPYPENRISWRPDLKPFSR